MSQDTIKCRRCKKNMIPILKGTKRICPLCGTNVSAFTEYFLMGIVGLIVLLFFLLKYLPEKQATTISTINNEVNTAIPNQSSEVNNRQELTSQEQNTNATDNTKAETFLPSYKSNSYDELIEEGKALIKKGIYQEAVVALTEAIKLKPDVSSAYVLRGLIYCLVDRTDMAEADFGEAIKLKPNKTTYYLYRGLAKLRHGGGKEDLDHVIQIDPDSEIAYFFRGYYNYLIGNKSQAAKDQEKAKDFFKLKALSYNEMGKAFMSLGYFTVFVTAFIKSEGAMPADDKTPFSAIDRCLDGLTVKQVDTKQKTFTAVYSNFLNLLFYAEDDEALSALKKMRVGDEIGVKYQARSDLKNLAMVIINHRDTSASDNPSSSGTAPAPNYSSGYSSDRKKVERDEIRRKLDALQPALRDYCLQGNDEACRQYEDWESLRKY